MYNWRSFIISYTSSWTELYYLIIEIERDHPEAVQILQLLDTFGRAMLSRMSDTQTNLGDISERIVGYLSDV